MLVSCFMMILLVQSDAPYVLWLKSNKRMELKEPPKCEATRCLVTLKNGQVMTLPSNMVDLDRSQKYNEELEAKRQAAKAEEERIYREVKELEAKEEERKKQRRLVVTSDKLPQRPEPVAEAAPPVDDDAAETPSLPGLDTGEDTLEGNTPEADTPEAGTPEEGTPEEEKAGNQSQKPPPQPTLQGKTTNFQSSDPVYVSRETVQPTATGYNVTSVVHIGVNNVKAFTLEYHVSFQTAAAYTQKQEVKGPWSINADVTVTFQVPTKDLITSSSYNLMAEQMSTRATPAQ